MRFFQLSCRSVKNAPGWAFDFESSPQTECSVCMVHLSCPIQLATPIFMSLQDFVPHLSITQEKINFIHRCKSSSYICRIIITQNLIFTWRQIFWQFLLPLCLAAYLILQLWFFARLWKSKMQWNATPYFMLRWRS